MTPTAIRPSMNAALQSEWPTVLRTWASLGLSGTLRRQAAPDWLPITRMIEAARPAIEAKANYLRALLQECGTKFAPLGEPLEIDLGLHRWLDAEREEAYSDWLEWVVRQAKTPSRVFRLFGLEVPSGLRADAQLDVKREDPVPHGHEDHEGRLDIVISFDGRRLIIVEVKKGDADDADTAKHAGYLKSHSNVECVLLAMSFTLTWCASTLRSLDADDVRRIVESIPAAWDVAPEARTALCELICGRATYVADRIAQGWKPA